MNRILTGALAVSISMMCAGEVLLAGDRSRDDDQRRHSPTQPLQSHEDVEKRERDRDRHRDRDRDHDLTDLETRTIDGSGNNPDFPDWGRADIPFLRLSFADYSDRVGAPAGPRRPSPRQISNQVSAQTELVANEAGASDFLWLWGQFLDHDIDHTPTITPVEPFDIPIPFNDLFFDPDGTGLETIDFDRSLYLPVDGIREQLNLITAWIDASNVYGSEPELAEQLRTLDGSGRLKTSDGNLLPFNPADPTMFIAGDARANEQVGLTAMHTLFVREHNYWADHFSDENRRLDGDKLYEMARMMVAAEIQHITYTEFLPVLMGPDGLAPYRGYREDVNPGISNEFATASYRFGHSMVSPQLLRLDDDNEPALEGPLSLRDAFFNPAEIIDHGIDSLLRGFAGQAAQRVDVAIIDDLRNFLFGPPGAGGFDLASLNIQRGRDHGLPPYNEVRRRLGLPAAGNFADINSDPEVQARLAAAYETVEDIDLWVGGLAEEHLPGALVGETVATVLANQFERLRDGDRFWYRIHLPEHLRDDIERQSLAEIIRRNTGIGVELQDNVFLVRDDDDHNWDDDGGGDHDWDGHDRNHDRDRDWDADDRRGDRFDGRGRRSADRDDRDGDRYSVRRDSDRRDHWFF